MHQGFSALVPPGNSSWVPSLHMNYPMRRTRNEKLGDFFGPFKLEVIPMGLFVKTSAVIAERYGTTEKRYRLEHKFGSWRLDPG